MPVSPGLKVDIDDGDELLKTIKLPVDLEVIIPIYAEGLNFLSNSRPVSLKQTTSTNIPKSACHQCENNENSRKN